MGMFHGKDLGIGDLRMTPGFFIRDSFPEFGRSVFTDPQLLARIGSTVA